MRLRKDLSNIGLDVEYNLSLRPYSKSYFGRYDVATNTIIIYVQKTPKGGMYSYEDLFLTHLHEALHCKQWSDPNYKRLKGVMHNLEFKKLYALYSNRAKALMLFRKVSNYDNSFKTNFGKSNNNFSFSC